MGHRSPTTGARRDENRGLWVKTELRGAAKCLDRTVQVSPPAADLTELMQRPSGPTRRRRQPLVDGLAGVTFGALEIAPETHDLGTVEPTETGESAQRVTLAAAERRLAPFAGPAPVPPVPAGEDGGAEDVSRRPQLEVSAQRGGHGLIDQRRSFGRLPAEQARVTHHQAAQRLEVAIREPVSEVDQLLTCVERSSHVAGEEHPLRQAEQDETALAARRLTSSSRLARANHPAATASRFRA
jgi:hypothetical protein